MTYTIRLAESAAKTLSKMDPPLRRRIEAKILALAQNPFPPGVRKIAGEQNTYRIRIGDYRVVYDVHSAILVILILRVGHRSDVYR